VVSSDSASRFAPLDGPGLKITIEKGKKLGLNAHFLFRHRGSPEPEEAYFRYYLRLGDNWNPTVSGGKLPGFAGLYNKGGWGMRKSNGSNGWSARGGFMRATAAAPEGRELRAIGSYVYHADMPGRTGDSWGWSLGPTGLLEKNRWYSVEQHVKLNRPGASDGVLRAWIDGKLVFSRDKLRFREVAELKIESVWLNIYHGGLDPTNSDLTLFMDNLVVARSYIGPATFKP
jgi:hypothetical protein